MLRAIPSPYLHYYYFPSEVLEHQRTHRSRAEEVMEIEAGLLELYRDPALDEKPKLLEERGGAFYSEAAAALVASLHAGTGDVQVVNVRNAGAIPNLPDDDVVEIPARIDRDGAHPEPTAPLAPEMLGIVQHAKAYERLAIDAATTGDRTGALKALIANPLVGDYAARRPACWMRCSRRTAPSSRASSPRDERRPPSRAGDARPVARRSGGSDHEGLPDRRPYRSRSPTSRSRDGRSRISSHRSSCCGSRRSRTTSP